mmetsp:Transcript_100186/g.177762  ORF Transcript_100186/g.177762 Transcript_100186/m.177762 type:complete len:96 (-) Transcript_100186:188-475(-)
MGSCSSSPESGVLQRKKSKDFATIQRGMESYHKALLRNQRRSERHWQENEERRVQQRIRDKKHSVDALLAKRRSRQDMNNPVAAALSGRQLGLEP